MGKSRFSSLVSGLLHETNPLMSMAFLGTWLYPTGGLPHQRIEENRVHSHGMRMQGPTEGWYQSWQLVIMVRGSGVMSGMTAGEARARGASPTARADQVARAGRGGTSGRHIASFDVCVLHIHSPSALCPPPSACCQPT